MARDDVADAELRGAAVERLPPEDAAVGAVAPAADGGDDLVHGPAVERGVAEDVDGQAGLRGVAAHGGEGVVAVPADPFVDGQQDEVEAVGVPLVEGLQDRGEHGGVFAPRGADGDALALVEEPVGGDGAVDLGLEDGEEAGFAELLAVLGADDQGAGGLAEGAQGWRHDRDVVLLRCVGPLLVIEICGRWR